MGKIVVPVLEGYNQTTNKVSSINTQNAYYY